MGLFYSGIKGSLTVDGVKFGKVREWRISGSAKTGETTTVGDYAPTYRVLSQSYSGGLKLFYYRDEAENVESKALVGRIMTPGSINATQTVALELAASDIRLTFDAFVTGVSFGATAGQVMSIDLDFVVNGPLKTVALGGAD